MGEVIVVIGAGQIGQAIARRVSFGKHVLLADLHQGMPMRRTEVLSNAGFEVSTATVGVSSRESVHALVQTATACGDITGVIHAAGVSPSQAPPATILAVDLYGTALVLEEFGNVIAGGGAGIVIASQSGHRLGALTAEQDAALATTPTEELLGLPMLARPGDRPPPRLPAGQAREFAAGDGRGCPVGQARRASPHDQPRHYLHPARQGRADRTPRRGIPAHDRVVSGRAGGTPDEVGAVGALLMGPEGTFITGSEFLMDGGVTASYFYGELAPR